MDEILQKLQQLEQTQNNINSYLNALTESIDIISQDIEKLRSNVSTLDAQMPSRDIVDQLQSDVAKLYEMIG